MNKKIVLVYPRVGFYTHDTGAPAVYIYTNLIAILNFISFLNYMIGNKQYCIVLYVEKFLMQ